MPYLILKVALSLDGFIDDIAAEPYSFSSPEDLVAVNALRADVDAILVGGNTYRRDNPSLKLKSNLSASGQNPVRVVISKKAEFDPSSKIFESSSKDSEPSVFLYVENSERERVEESLGNKAICVSLLKELDIQRRLAFLIKDLAQRGKERILVEAGGQLAGTLLSSNMVDELRISVAPIFLADKGGVRFSATPLDISEYLTLVETKSLGRNAILRFERKKL